MKGQSVTLAEIKSMSAVSLHYVRAHAELDEIAKIISGMTTDLAERKRLWSGIIELLVET